MFDLNSDPHAKKYIPGYTGHIPANWSESDFQKEKCSYYIPSSRFVTEITMDSFQESNVKTFMARLLEKPLH